MEILSQYNDLVESEFSDLKRFLNLEIYQLTTNNDFVAYSDRAYKKLQANRGSDDKELSLKERLCYYHFAYYKVLYTTVNDAFIVTYSSPAFLHKSVSNSISGEENLLEYIIDYLNHCFYKENHSRFYRLTIRRKDLLKQRKTLGYFINKIKKRFLNDYVYYCCYGK